MSWGTLAQNVWNLMFAVFLVVLVLGQVTWSLWNWRREGQRAREERAALERGDPAAVEHVIVLGVLSGLMALAGLVAFAKAPEQERWKMALATAFFVLCAVVLLVKGVRARARRARKGRD